MSDATAGRAAPPPYTAPPVAPPPVSAPPAGGPPKRWLPALVFLVTLSIASVLLFTRVHTTTIELTGTFGGIGFVSAREQPLSRPLRVTALGAAGLKDARLPEEAAGASNATALRVAVNEQGDAKVAGSIVVDRIVVPQGTRVWLTRTDPPLQWRLSLRPPTGAEIDVHADVMGSVTLAAGAAPSVLVLRAPRAIDFTSSGGNLDLDLTLPVGVSIPRWEQLVVRDLRLHHVEDELDASRPLVRPVSTIESGSLYFEELGGTERKLRAGEMLRFGTADGTLLTLDLRDDGIATTFQGDVSEMRTGSGDEPRSLMPTWLEWLRKRQALSLLWGTALYLSGIGLTLRRWWRKPE